MTESTAQPVFISALSEAVDSADALREVVDSVTPRVAWPVDLLVLFATPHHREALGSIAAEFVDRFNPRVSLGATAEGVIGSRREVESRPGLSVLLASLHGAQLKPFSYDQLDWPALLDDADKLRRQLSPDGVEPKAVMLIADPFSTPVTGLLSTLHAACPGLPVFGGMASAASEPGGNRLLINGKWVNEGAVGLAIAGGVDVSLTVSQGCRPIGKPFVITRAKRHIVQELGGAPALTAIQQMIGQIDGDDRAMLQEHGLMVGRVINEYKERFGRGDFLIRGVIGVDQEAGYIAIGDPHVRVGQTIQFHVRDRKTAKEDFQLLLEAQKLHGPAAGALLFSCNGRGTRLFDTTDADANNIHSALGDVPLAGFFAAGEIGPIGNENFVHGHTASLAVFRAAPA